MGGGEYPFPNAKELNYSWEELKSMVDNGDIAPDINIADYKTIKLSNGEVMLMEVAGIDTHSGYNALDGKYHEHHIDFISRDCLASPVQWSTSGNNNSTNSAKPYPYIVSTVHTYLNNTIYSRLPEDVKPVIVDRCSMMETRLKNGNTLLTESTGRSWVNIGKLWLPNEVEVQGQTVFGSKDILQGEIVQYPLFKGGCKTRQKKSKGRTGYGYCRWLTCCADGSSSTNVCVVNGTGVPGRAEVTNDSTFVPLCFRIASHY